jgi:hypothetical protein
VRLVCPRRACSRVAAAQFVLLIFGSDLICSVLCYTVDELLYGDVDIPLESPDQKTQTFLILITLGGSLNTPTMCLVK